MLNQNTSAETNFFLANMQIDTVGKMGNTFVNI